MSKKFRVTVPFIVWVSTIIEDESVTTKEEAQEAALQDIALTNYGGNNGMDRLIGSYNTEDTIEAGEPHIYDADGYAVDVEEIEDSE